MSGGTPADSGSVRQRFSQGELADDTSSSMASSSIPADHRPRTWTEVLENIAWLALAAFIIYLGDRKSNLISLFLWDARIRSMTFYLGFCGILLNIVALLIWGPWKSYDNPEVLPTAAPLVVVLGFVSFSLLSFALWPIWSYLTIPLLITLFMTLMVIASYAPSGPLRPQASVLRND